LSRFTTARLPKSPKGRPSRPGALAPGFGVATGKSVNWIYPKVNGLAPVTAELKEQLAVLIDKPVEVCFRQPPAPQPSQPSLSGDAV